ncbi:hypothetical protein UlMin_025037 [Ulmus minor]
MFDNLATSLSTARMRSGFPDNPPPNLPSLSKSDNPTSSLPTTRMSYNHPKHFGLNIYFHNRNEKMETVESETEAYAIADMLYYVKSKVYTVNCGMEFGQATLLLSLRAKGHRAMQPNSSTKLYLPKVNRSSGAIIDMWIKAKELDADTKSYIDLLEKGIGKPKEDINYNEMLAQSRAMKRSAGSPPLAAPSRFR